MNKVKIVKNLQLHGMIENLSIKIQDFINY